MDSQKGINVLSLFDGMSCGQIALNAAGIKINNYFASEIDKHAISVTQKNFPNTKQMGGVKIVRSFMLPKIDLLIAGSPCQGFSFAGKQLNFKDPRSALFFEYVRLLKELRGDNPDMYFLLENVVMKKEYQNIISEYLGVQPILINSALVSAQNRKRLYWTNIPNITQPKDRGLVIADILETPGATFVKNLGTYRSRPDKGMCLDANYFKGADNHGQRTLVQTTKPILVGRKNASQDGKIVSDSGKSYTLTAGNANTPKVAVETRDAGLTLAGIATDVKGLDTHKRVYAPNGKSPTLCSNSGGNHHTKISLDSYLTPEQVERGIYQASAKIWKSGNRMGNMDFPNDPDKKAKTLTVVSTKGGRETNHVLDEHYYRKLTPIECERLQTVPDNYTAFVSDTQRYKMLGNGWTIAVIVHIIKNIKPKNLEFNKLLL